MGLKPNDRSESILRFPAAKAQSNQMFTDSEQLKLVNSRFYFDRPLSALEPAFGRRKSENAWIRMAAIQIQGLSRNKSQTPNQNCSRRAQRVKPLGFLAKRLHSPPPDSRSCFQRGLRSVPRLHVHDSRTRRFTDEIAGYLSQCHGFFR
jgi:hypothetical protein